MEKTGEFVEGKSKCDICGHLATAVDKHGMASCYVCKRTAEMQKQACSAHLGDHSADIKENEV